MYGLEPHRTRNGGRRTIRLTDAAMVGTSSNDFVLPSFSDSVELLHRGFGETWSRELTERAGVVGASWDGAGGRSSFEED